MHISKQPFNLLQLQVSCSFSCPKTVFFVFFTILKNNSFEKYQSPCNKAYLAQPLIKHNPNLKTYVGPIELAQHCKIKQKTLALYALATVASAPPADVSSAARLGGNLSTHAIRTHDTCKNRLKRVRMRGNSENSTCI